MYLRIALSVILVMQAACSTDTMLLGSFKSTPNYAGLEATTHHFPDAPVSTVVHVAHLPYHDAGAHCRMATGAYYAEACAAWVGGHCHVVMPKPDGLYAAHYAYLWDHEVVHHCQYGRADSGEGRYYASGLAKQFSRWGDRL